MIVDEEAAEEAADEEVDEESGDDSQEDTTDLLTSAIPDLEGLSRRELKRLERQKKRDEKKQSRKNKQYKECDEGDRKCGRCLFCNYSKLLLFDACPANAHIIHNLGLWSSQQDVSYNNLLVCVVIIDQY